MKRTLADIFPACARLAEPSVWQKLETEGMNCRTAAAACRLIGKGADSGRLPFWMKDLSRLELGRHRLRRQHKSSLPASIRITPGLKLLPVSWQGLPQLLDNSASTPPVKDDTLVIVWRHPVWHSILIEEATPSDLLVLKLTAEGISPQQAAAEGGVSLAVIEDHISHGIDRGILESPPSLLRREAEIFDPEGCLEEEQLSAAIFTLQWHITQRCDLRCRHCYDRSDRRDVDEAEGMAILQQLRSFCLSRHVRGQVTFTGGNPFMHPRFSRLYQAAVDLGFITAILGNPVKEAQLEPILTIRKPAYYQVSLEGRRDHNDAIRGKGHYERTMGFLELLKRLQVPSMVMLTLTRDNMADVIPLGRELEGLTDGLAFNRLALEGEGAQLQLPEPVAYRAFLEEYAEALKSVPVLALKDNLLNSVFHCRGDELFSGCAGYGCGAAFNFLSLLPDGEVHACRKFTSPVGNLADATLSEIYDAPAARRYRQGSAACRGCHLRGVCGGCMAVTGSMGMDPFTDRDPFCLHGPHPPHGHNR